jgi:hypothetical protein
LPEGPGPHAPSRPVSAKSIVSRGDSDIK